MEAIATGQCRASSQVASHMETCGKCDLNGGLEVTRPVRLPSPGPDACSAAFYLFDISSHG
eukprot:6216325-Prymnesium_polylepis.1